MKIIKHNLKRQNGTSFFEAIVFSLFTIPFLVLIPHLMKIMDFKMQMPQASRYASWSTTLKPSPNINQNDLNSISKEINARVFSQSKIVKEQPDYYAMRSFWNLNRFNQAEKVYEENSLSLKHSKFSSNTDTSKFTINTVTFGIGAISNLDNIFSSDNKKTFSFNPDLDKFELSFNLNTLGLTQGVDCQNSESSFLCFNIKSVMYTDRLAPTSQEEQKNQLLSLKPFSNNQFMADAIAFVAQSSIFFEEGKLFADAPEYVPLEQVPNDKLEQ